MANKLFSTKRFTHFIIFVLFICSLGFSSNNNDFRQDSSKITGEVFIKNNAYKMLKILSDEIGPRLTGSESAHKAASYCLNLFKKYGLSNVHLEHFDTVGWLPGDSMAETIEPLHRSLEVDSMGLSINTPPEGLIAEIFDVGHGTKIDFKRNANDIQGKIVLVGAKEPPFGQASTKELEKISYAADNRALACIIISSYKGKLIKTRTSSDGDFSPIPAVGITYEDGTWLRRLLGDDRKVKVKIVVQNKILDKLQSENVIADILGTEKPEEMVILGAHLDSWNLGPGAADNGLGDVITLETARILTSLHLKPKRTIRFVLFTGEEQGLIGSSEYVKRHESKLDNIVLMVNLDMTGSMYPGFLNPYGGWDYKGKLDDLLTLLKGFGIDRIEQRYPYDSDDFNFVAKGVPAMGLQGRGQKGLTYAHTYADTIDKIEIDKLNLTTAAIAIIIHYVANTKEPVGKRLSQEQIIEFFKAKNLE